MSLETYAAESVNVALTLSSSANSLVETIVATGALAALNNNFSSIVGFADGSFVNGEREVDAYVKTVSADGRPSRTKLANKSGRVTLTLKQESPSNDVLSAIAQLDEKGTDGANGVFTLIVQDSSGRALMVASDAWIVKQATQEFATESSDREWMIDCGKLETYVGGNN